MTMTPRLRAMTDAVRALYDRNRQRGFAAWCQREYDFVCPSMGTYPFQWFWDSCFHAVALSHVDVERSRIEMRSLLANQQPDGFVAHVTFWQRERFEELLSTYAIAYRTPYLSDCMQPPVLAEAVAAGAQGDDADAYLREIVPKVRRYFDWLDRVRDPDRDGLIATLQPDESGLDHTPKYDEYLGVSGAVLADYTAAWERVAHPYAEVGRDHDTMFALDRFVDEDVFVNTIYAENQRVLADLLDRIGDSEGSQEMRSRAARTSDALIRKCFDEPSGLFFDLAGLDERMLRVNTVSSVVPIVLPDLPADCVRALVRHLEDPSEYAAEFPVPSVALNEPSYLPPAAGNKLVWRGPTWINSNWYIARGLRRHGRADLARRIEDRSAALIEGDGFREYYDPHTGQGFGARDFSWTALAIDLLTTHEAEL
jgi:hypothetical protein